MTFWEAIFLWYLSGIIICVLCCAVTYKIGDPLTPGDIIATFIFSFFGPLCLIPFFSMVVPKGFWDMPLLQRKDKQK